MNDDATLASNPQVADRLRRTLLFDLHQLEPRDGYQHFTNSELHSAAKTEAVKKEIAQKTGAKYTALNVLPYWDSTRQVIVDVMHGIHLGTPHFLSASSSPFHTPYSLLSGNTPFFFLHLAARCQSSFEFLLMCILSLSRRDFESSIQTTLDRHNLYQERSAFAHSISLLSQAYQNSFQHWTNPYQVRNCFWRFWEG